MSRLSIGGLDWREGVEKIDLAKRRYNRSIGVSE